MASRLSVASFALTLALVASASCFAQQPEENGWTSLSVGQTLYGIQYRQERTLWIFDRKITTCPEEWERPVVSNPSPGKKFVVVMCESDEGPDRPHVVNLGSGAVYPVISKGIGPQKSLLDKWVSWSPNEDYALLASGGEGFQGPMVLVNLRNGVVKDLEYRRLGLRGETEVLDQGSVSWLNTNSFRLKFNIVCQVFDDHPRCASGPCRECDNVIHRTYWARVNLNPLSVSYSTAPPSVARSATASPKSAIAAPTPSSGDCKFCGTWKAVIGGRIMGRRADDYAGKSGNPYCGCTHLRITRIAADRFKLNIGSEYEGKINWAHDGDTIIQNADAIYLRPTGGKLTARFVSMNFYATHGKKFTYQITCELNGNEMLFSVLMIGGQTEKAKYVKVDE